jgi:predicted acetyltransferase
VPENSPIELRFRETTLQDLATLRAVTDHFTIVERVTQNAVGSIRIRHGFEHVPALEEDVRLYAGHVGYSVDEVHRGKGYALQACRALTAHATALGYTSLIVTCNPDNVASRRVCEKLGATLIEIIELPPDNDQRIGKGDTHKCRYAWALPIGT